MTAELFYKSECMLGEGPSWHAERKSFFWVDIDGKCFYEFHTTTKEVTRRQLAHRVSLILQTKASSDIILLGVQGGLASYDLTKEKFIWLLDIEKEQFDHRTNDGAVDSEGRLWIGTMHRQFEKGAGSLYCVDNNFSVQRKITGVTISNGLAWSLDNSRMYFIDTPTQTVQSFLFDAETGNIQFEKIAITIDKKMGSPDGMAIDEEGMLWIAQWDGFGVYRWDPVKGKLLDKIDVPVPQVSSCAFGGDNMDELIITTARENFTEEDAAKYPLSGNIFIAKPGVKGIAPNKFG